MKLSQAIREGAARRAQAFQAFFFRTKETLGSCTLGAAFEACGGNPDSDVSRIRMTLFCEYPELIRKKATCPVDGCDMLGSVADLLDNDMYHVITHLNDEHRWTREQIADWVASIEVQDEVVAGH